MINDNECIDFRDHIDLVYILWLEDTEMELPCDRCFIRPGSLTCLGCKLNFNNAVGS